MSRLLALGQPSEHGHNRCPVIVGGGEQPFAELSVDRPAPANEDEAGSGTVTLGDTLTCTITATNTGTATLTNVVVTDSLITPNSTTCASLAPTETCVLVGAYQVTADDVTAGEIVNTGTADSEDTDPVTDDETVTVEDSGGVGLSIVKTFTPASVSQGSTHSFTIEVSNAGPLDATGVSITERVNRYLEVTDVSVASGSGDCSASSGQNVDCTVDILSGRVSDGHCGLFGGTVAA